MNLAHQIAHLFESTARECGSSAGIGPGMSSNGPPRDASIWGDHTAVLRTCAVLGLSRAVESDVTREDGTRIQQWHLSDVDGEVRGRVVYDSLGGNARSSATIWNVIERPLACLATAA